MSTLLTLLFALAVHLFYRTHTRTTRARRELAQRWARQAGRP